MEGYPNKQNVINFIVNNDKLELLNARINKFNPFKILKIQDYEIRHSNIIAWIFDPNGNHNFDDRVLKKFLLAVLLKPENDEVLTDLDLGFELQQMPLLDIQVSRELHNIDILLKSEQHSIIIYIENKVFSGEGKNQLSNYYKTVEDKYPNFKLKIPIFLTLDGAASEENNNYYLASYEELLIALEFALENYKERTSAEVITFLSYYITILKEKYYMDKETKELCKQIYQQNREVIDMIYTVGKEIDIADPLERFRQNYTNVEVVVQKNRFFFFAIDEFSAAKKELDDGWAGGYHICFWFSEYRDKLKFALEVGPFDDAKKRVEFLRHLESFEIKINERAKDPGRKYSRIYTKTSPIEDWDDSDEVFETMKKLYEDEDMAELKKKAIVAVQTFKWGDD